VEAFGDLRGILQEMMGDVDTPPGGSPSSPSGASESEPGDEDDEDEGPSILPFQPRGD
jgi:hypothetical protein